jgi:hypothetical protein
MLLKEPLLQRDYSKAFRNSKVETQFKEKNLIKNKEITFKNRKAKIKF